MSGTPPTRHDRLVLDPTAYIAPGAVVVGDVTLGARASVWFNTVVRGDSAPIEVGADTNLQDLVTVHVDEGQPAVIGARVTVGHGAIVHGCAIGDDCLIGMGAIVLSGARVGEGSLLGAGALVREGQVIPPRSIALGLPARVTGVVDDAHRGAIRAGAAHYVERARQYLARGFQGAAPVDDRAAGRASIDRGPMSEWEWSRLVETLAGFPAWARSNFDGDETRWRRRPGADRWSALEVLCHLADADRDIYLPRLDRLLRESMPFVEDVDMRGWERERRYQERPVAGVLDAWSADRATLVARLAALGPAEWDRPGIHSRRGPFTVAHLVRYCVEHDLSHRRQAARALEAAS